MIRTGVDKIHETSTAVKFSEKNGSVGLRIRTLDPLQTRANTAIVTATFAKYSATITTHPHYEQQQEQQWQNRSIKSKESVDRKLGEKGFECMKKKESRRGRYLRGKTGELIYIYVYNVGGAGFFRENGGTQF